MKSAEENAEHITDDWRKAAAEVPESIRQRILTMMKQGASVGEVCEAVGLHRCVVIEIGVQGMKPEAPGGE